MWTYLISFWKQVFNDQKLKTSQELWMLSLVPLKDVSVFCSLLSEMVTSLENRFQNVFVFLSVHVFSSLCDQMSERSTSLQDRSLKVFFVFAFLLDSIWYVSPSLGSQVKYWSVFPQCQGDIQPVSQLVTRSSVELFSDTALYECLEQLREAVHSKKNY